MTRLTILFCLFCSAAFAQKEVQPDSTWLTNNAGVFIENRLIQYDDGTYLQTGKIIGDTAKLIESARRIVSERAESMAADVAIVSGYSKDIAELIRRANSVETAVGSSTYQPDTATTLIVNPLRAIATDLLADMQTGTWQIGQNTVVFSMTAGGQARYKLGTEPTRNCSVLGNVVRMNNYLGGGSVDLFRITKRKFITLDGAIKMTR